jgi:hypothetical protein
MEMEEIAADDDLERALALFDEQLARLGLDLGGKVKPGIEWVETQWRLNLLDEDDLRCRDLDTLWAWHEGGFSPWLPYDLYDLDEAVRETREQRSYDSEGYPFPLTWICVAVRNGARLAIDTTAGQGSASMVYHVHPETPNDPFPGQFGRDADGVEMFRMTPFWGFY